MNAKGLEVLRKRAELARKKLKGKSNFSYGKKEQLKLFCENEIKIKTISDDEYFDTKTYNKLKEIIKEDVINPMQYFMNNTYFKSLDEAERELYILTCLSKYRKFKERFNSENQMAL